MAFLLDAGSRACRPAPAVAHGTVAYSLLPMAAGAQVTILTICPRKPPPVV
jgi:hypothetical protein